jgi:D-alanyl-D-alanine carboxypeptidase
MKKTTFKNASGLPHKQQKSTARDMSILAQTLINKLPKYYNYFSIQSFVYKGKVFKNHNKLLQKYKGTDGIKTGYINASGFNLVASTKRDGTRLIGVVFGGKTANRRDRQMKRILNRSWERAQSFSLLRARPLPKHFIPKIEAQVLKNSSSEIEISLTSTNWGIQIGAFSKYKEARDIGSHTVHKLINLPVTASLKIQAVSKSNNTLFRTRLMGLNEMGARASCKQILVNGRECKIVTPNE